MKRIYPLVIALSLAAAAFFYLSDGPEQAVFGMAEGSYMEDVRLVNTKDGTLAWDLRAASAEFFDEGSRVRLKEVTATIPEKDITMRSESGVYNIQGGEFTVQGGVEARISSYDVSAKSLKLNADRGEISSDGRVVLRGRGVRIEGTGLRAEESLQVRLLSDVRAEFVLDRE